MAGLSSIDGINSGLNTTEIIDSILQVERRPALLMEARQSETTNMVSALKAFQAKLLALNTSIGTLNRQSAFEAASIQVSDEDFLGATSSGRVSTGSYDIQVLSVARNHTVASQGFADQSLAAFGTGTLTLQLGTGSSKTITIDSTNNSLVGIKKAINDANLGIAATIINDGSSSNPFRLVLTGNKTGQKNNIAVSGNLTGGSRNLNFGTALFDAPETISANTATTALMSLGATASFSGATNKVYTFTVAGTGSQTVGTDNITLNWTDGTNSGTILVSQADTETALVGIGADGLKINLSAGKIYAGDKFQVQTFAPLLQEASDARLALGSGGGTGSPITVTSETNTFKDIIGGITLTAKKVTEPGDSVTVNADIDLESIKSNITAFLKSYNDVNNFVNEQNKYNTDTQESGVLFGEYTLNSVQSSLRLALSSAVAGLKGSKYNQLVAIGIRADANGNLTIRDSGKLDEALKSNLDDVIKLFLNSGSSASPNIEFVAATEKTRVGSDYSVDITRAATRGVLSGSGLSDPATTPLTLTAADNRLKFTVDGLTSGEIVLEAKTYASSSELVNEIQNKINADGTIGTRGVTVSWESTGVGTGYLKLTNSSYGSTSKVAIVGGLASSAYVALGLATGISHDGVDVAGTINGEQAEGKGQVLVGKDGNKTTAGLRLKITFEASQIIDGAEGKITLSKGVSAQVSDILASFTKSGDGLIDRRIKAFENQVKDLKGRIEDFDKRLLARREDLLKKFYAMEAALGNFNSIGDYLTGQVANMNSNWNFNR